VSQNDLPEERACYQNHVAGCKSLGKKKGIVCLCVCVCVCCSQKSCSFFGEFSPLRKKKKKRWGLQIIQRFFLFGKTGPKSPYFEEKKFEIARFRL